MESIELPELTPQVVMSTLFLGLVVRSLVAPPTSSPGATTLTLVRSPFSTVAHAVAQLKHYLLWARQVYLPNRLLVALLALAALVYGGFQVQGPHRALLEQVWFYSEFLVWWIGLGIMSSVGLGTGMHTVSSCLKSQYYFPY